jgi:ADP-ribose pyrophosphatase YjhB (NUDIX family)
MPSSPESEPKSYRKPPSSRLAVLLIKRGEHPFMNCWALPGEFLRRGEEMEHCAQRELFEEAGNRLRVTAAA